MNSRPKRVYAVVGPTTVYLTAGIVKFTGKLARFEVKADPIIIRLVTEAVSRCSQYLFAHHTENGSNDCLIALGQ